MNDITTQPAEPTRPDLAETSTRRRGRRLLIVLSAGIAIAATFAVGTWWMTRDGSAGAGLRVEDEAGTELTAVKVRRDRTPDAARGLSELMTALTPLYSVTSTDSAEQPAVLRFDLPRTLTPVQRRSLVLGSQRLPAGGWTITPATADGDQAVVRVSHFSRKQIFELRGAASLATWVTEQYNWVARMTGQRAEPCSASPAGSTFITETSAPGAGDSPPVLACMGPSGDDGRPVVTLSNQRGVAFDVDLPDGASVEGVSSPSLTEQFWKTLYGGLQSTSAFLPAGGTMTISLAETPSDIGLIANNAAFSSDVLIAATAAGKLTESATGAGKLAEVVDCVYELNGATRPDVLDDPWDPAVSSWEACGGPASELPLPSRLRTAVKVLPEVLFALPGTAIKGLDSVRSLKDGAETVHVRSTSGGRTIAPSDGYRVRFDMQWRSSSGDGLDLVFESKDVERLSETGDGFVSSCFHGDPERAGVIAGYIQLTGRTANGYSTSWAPQVFAQEWRGDDLGGFSRDGLFLRDLDSLEGVVVETDRGCPSGLGGSNFGRYTLDGGASTAQLPFHIIYSDLYGPATPDGDKTRIPNLGARVIGGGTTNAGILLGSFAGPDCLDGPGAGPRSFMPLTGSNGPALADLHDADEDQLPGCS